MGERWRILDTGLRSPSQNVALDRALLEARRTEEIPTTLRFCRQTACVLLGALRSARHDVDVEYCQKSGVPLQRRITGGPSVYAGESHIGWRLYLHRKDLGPDAGNVSKRLCHAVATAVSALGVDARYRAPDEIEIDGRHIGFAAIGHHSPALLVEGMLIMDAHEDRMARLLRMPAIADAKACFGDRVAGLTELLGRRADARALRQNIREALESDFDIDFVEGDLTLSEQMRYEVALRETATADWNALVFGSAADVPLLVAECKRKGIRLRAAVLYDEKAACVERAAVEIDAAVRSPRTLRDLEAALRGAPAAALDRKIQCFFANHRAGHESLTAQDFAAVFGAAIMRSSLAKKGPLSERGIGS